MRAILFVVAVALLGCAVAKVSLQPSTTPLADRLHQLSERELQEFCDNVNHKSHQQFSPIRCARSDEDHAASGKKFVATHDMSQVQLNPVVMLPGLGGSALEAKIKKTTSPAWYCFKKHDWFRIWFAVEELLVQPCWMDNLDVDFHPDSGNYTNTEGVEMAPADFGGMKGVAYLDYVFGLPIKLTSVYSDIIASLKAVGYKAGENLHGAPYDWRLPATYTERIGWYDQFKSLIETTYAQNGNMKVHIVTHSMGGPTALYFLNSMNQTWLDTYIASFIPIAGPWTGSPNALRAVLSGDDFGLSVLGISVIRKLKLRDIARKAGGIVELIPNTDLNTAGIPFVNVKGKNYTIPDFPQLFGDIDSAITQDVYKQVGGIIENLHGPEVPVHCVYGFGVPTEMFYSYPEGDFSKDPIITETNQGDGTVPLYSLQECQDWAKYQSAPVDIKAFELVGHSDILHNDNFLQYLITTVTAPL